MIPMSQFESEVCPSTTKMAQTYHTNSPLKDTRVALSSDPTSTAEQNPPAALQHHATPANESE